MQAGRGRGAALEPAAAPMGRGLGARRGHRFNGGGRQRVVLPGALASMPSSTTSVLVLAVSYNLAGEGSS